MKNKNSKDKLQNTSPETLAALADIDYINQQTKLVFPTIKGVEEAKEWVETTEK